MTTSSDDKVSIIVVGAGIAGLAFSIEAHLRGHNVQIFEKRAEPGDFGP
jgi:2-polyprenyl-6-methoxyphenol hydroxylase-like FAD-dependent oxidoreductase